MFGVEKFYPYVYGWEFVSLTDHKLLILFLVAKGYSCSDGQLSATVGFCLNGVHLSHRIPMDRKFWSSRRFEQATYGIVGFIRRPRFGHECNYPSRHSGNISRFTHWLLHNSFRDREQFGSAIAEKKTQWMRDWQKSQITFNLMSKGRTKYLLSRDVSCGAMELCYRVAHNNKFSMFCTASM